MTCDEFQRVLPESWGAQSSEEQEHVKSCRSCADLVLDLQAISDTARLLQATDEPSPRVWNSIEIALRREGLIHEARPLRSFVFAWPQRRLAWLMPLTAVLALVFGVLIFERGGRSPGMSSGVETRQSTPGEFTLASAEEEQLLKMVADRAPALRPVFESDLRNVDAYIKDAELSARNNPNDEIAQQSLMNAYEQRAMVYQMALDRSVP